MKTLLIKQKLLLLVLCTLGSTVVFAGTRGGPIFDPDFTINQRVLLNNLPSEVSGVELGCILVCKANLPATPSIEKLIYQIIFEGSNVLDRRYIASRSSFEKLTPINGAINSNVSVKMKSDRFGNAFENGSDNDRARKNVNGYFCAIRLFENGQIMNYRDTLASVYGNARGGRTTDVLPLGIQLLSSKLAMSGTINNLFNPTPQSGGFQNCERQF